MLTRVGFLSGVGLLAIGVFCFSSEGKDAANAPKYYYQVSNSDGSVSIESLTNDDATAKQKDFLDKYKESMTTWLEQKKEWEKAFGQSGQNRFPVPPPLKGKLSDKKGRVSDDKATADKALEKLTKQIEVFEVYIVTNSSGSKSAEVIRKDKVHARTQELMKEYAQAVLAGGAAGGEAGKGKEGEKGGAQSGLTAPSLKRVGGQYTKSKDAYDAADKLGAKLGNASEPKEKEKGKKKE